MSPEVKANPQRAIVAAVQLPAVSDAELEASLKELRELARTLGFEVVATFTQKRASFDATAYLGTGKREEMRRFVQGEADPSDDAPPMAPDAEKGAGKREERRIAHHGAVAAREAATALAGADNRQADFVLVDHEISPSQARNLENEIGCEVMDRTMAILEIFHRHARSNAARAQVEIARLRYLAPRLREAAKLAGPQGRQRSGVGGRGAGEAAGEADRAKIRDRIAELKQEIIALDLERRTQRARRQESQGLARVALVGAEPSGRVVRLLRGAGRARRRGGSLLPRARRADTWLDTVRLRRRRDLSQRSALHGRPGTATERRQRSGSARSTGTTMTPDPLEPAASGLPSATRLDRLAS